MISTRWGALVGLVILATLTVLACSQPQPERPVVSMADSSYHGVWSENHDIAAFLGIPFAEPPVGERRWRAPAPVAEGVDVDASAFAAACMQGSHMVAWYQDLVIDFGGDPDAFPLPDFSEDCLYLNIWTPKPGPESGLPVMVWIHGGGHRGGWPNEPNYIGDELARKGVVVVSIAYRLDIFGFLSHPDLDIANFGLLDQAAALGWIRDNIHRFGGDPSNVTVFGESAGASSIAYLMASPYGQGLFKRAIHQSAGYELVNTDTREQFLEQGKKLEEQALASHGKSGIDALRLSSPDELLAAAASVFADYQPDVVVDGYTLTGTVESALQNDHLSPVDLIVGTNADEWLMYLPPDSKDSDVAKQAAEYGIVDVTSVFEVLSEDSSVLRQLDRLVTAREFVCPSLDLAAAIAGKKAAYVYYFSRQRPGDEAERVGAYHGAEIPYVFDKHDAWLPTDELDTRLGWQMADYWVSFATDGDPNVDGAPVWPRYSGDGGDVLEFGDTTRVIKHPETALCDAMVSQ